GLLAVLCRSLSHLLFEGFDGWIGILSGRQHDLQLIPKPGSAGREIEVVAFNGVTIGEGDAAACGLAGIAPIAGFEQHRVERNNFHDFPGNAVDSPPIAEADSVLAHEDDPADKTDDEI